MGVEIEKKYRLTDEQFTCVQETLAEFGAVYLGEDFEENSIYGGGALDERHAILRIRRTAEKAFLTFKERIHNDLAVKHQTEFETEVSDVAELARIVEALGFEVRVVYEKRRRTWKFRSVEVVLDELPFGRFMEIEGTVMTIAEAEMLLDAEEFEVVHESYPALAWNLGRRKGDRVEARFDP